MSSPIEDIKERLNIVEVIGEYVSLKKIGANYKARCPFHNEKTPSFTVSEPKQFFHCFGCAKGGDIFTFIQEIEGIEFPEALRILARKANVTLRPTMPHEHNERTRLFDCLQLAASFFHATLATSPHAKSARDYVTSRALLPETVDHFQLGYSLPSWDSLLSFLRRKNIPELLAERAGLILRSQKTNGWYDRFRGRLMFPIYNHHDQVIGFGGRVLPGDTDESKYMNSPQTDVYNKSGVLYGLSFAKRFIQKMDVTVIVEGYMDVCALHQAKFRNVVAASGTALTIEQVRLLKRYSSNVILAFDADRAGLAAAWRGMRVAIQEGMNIKVLVLPRGKDPDDVVRENPEEFRKLAIAAPAFMEYAFETVLSSLDLNNVLQKKKAAAELLPMIALFQDKIEQVHYIQLLADKLGVDGSILLERFLPSHAQKQTGRFVSAPTPSQQIGVSSVASGAIPRVIVPRRSRDEVTSALLCAFIMKASEQFSFVREHVEEGMFVGEPAVRLYKIMENIYNRDGFLDPKKVIVEDPTLQSFLQEIELLGEESVPMDSDGREQEILSLLRSLELRWIDRALRGFEQQLRSAERENDTMRIRELSLRVQNLLERRRVVE